MIFYILNVALILAGCFIFYKVLLQKETFFPLNRFVLLGCLALSFSLPLVPVPAKWSFRKTVEQIAVQTSERAVSPVTKTSPLPVATPQRSTQPVATVQQTADPGNFSILSFILRAYWIGVIIFAVNFLVQFITLLYRAYSSPVILDGKFRIVELKGDKAPCSFGSNIFINPEKYEWETYNQILLHEKIHIEQGHSFDILFAELALIFQWFNPFAWFYRKAVEDNLEFLTDSELLQHNSVERESYQMSLVKVSAPHFPVSLTTNYNQSILKKRLIMMNAKKSNIHTTWKYLFILPLMVAFVCFLNEPVAVGKTRENTNKGYSLTADFERTGVWFATISNNKMTIQFKKEEDDDMNNNSSTFDLSEFKDLPQGKTGTFSLTRDAGTITFTGKFEDKMGMGKYEFKEDKSYTDFLKSENIELTKDNDIIVFYFVNIKRSYVNMLKAEGYTNLRSNDLIPLAALNVDKDFIEMLKSNGFTNVPLKELIPLKAMGINDKYIKEIRDAGFKNVSYNQLITFKAQNMTGEFLKNSREAARNGAAYDSDKGEKGEKGDKGSRDDAEDDEDSAFENIIAMKALNISKEFIKGFTDIGYNVGTENLIAFKSLGVTPGYVKELESMGFKPDPDEINGMKGLGITTESVKAYKALGFKSLTLDDVISATATGTTPGYISTMKKKGFNFSSVDKYVSAKVLSITDIE